MRILYIVTAFPRWPGDIITPWLTETIERLRDRGVEVEVLAPSYRGDGAREVDGIRVHRFRYAPAAVETLTHDQTAPDRIRERPAYLGLVPGYVAAGSAAAVRLTRGGRFDCVHAFWPLPHSLFGLAARRVHGVPLVSTFFGVELTWMRRDLPFLMPVARAIIRRSDAVTVISSHTAREVHDLVPEATIRTIPFGAAVQPPEAPRPPRSERRAGEPFRLLFVGRLVERKGVSVLLQALTRLHGEDVILTVVGDGPLRARLEEEAETLGLRNRVEFTGFVPSEELAQRFDEADAFVLPAVRDSKGDVEGLGVVLLEATAHGKPVIASDSGGIRDIVVDDVTGLLTPSGDPDSLASAIDRLRANPALRERLVLGAERHVAEHFSWDRIIDDLCRLYEDVVAGRAKRSASMQGAGG